MKRAAETPQSSSVAAIVGKQRLGPCEVCANKAARYTCPRCEVKTCCFDCVQIHKKELKCNGIRDPTKFIPLREMSKVDFMSDYYFLEKCTRYAQECKSERLRNFLSLGKNDKPYGNAARLCQVASANKTKLLKLAHDFTRCKANTTIYHHKLRTIFWHVEWIFLNAGGAEGMMYVDNRCDENKTLLQLLDKYLNEKNTEEVYRKSELEYYQSAGVHNLKILLKAEGIVRCGQRYYKLDVSKTLKENLRHKTIVEYPSICLSYTEDEFDVIDSDEDVEAEAKQYANKLDELRQQQIQSNSSQLPNNEKAAVFGNTESKSIDKQQKKDAFASSISNYLIADEQQLELLDSSTSDEDEAATTTTITTGATL